MVQALIQINGQTGSDTDMPIDTLATLSNVGTGGEITYLWELLEQPDGAADALGSPTSSSCTLTPKKEGTYLVRLTVNKDLTTQKIDSVVLGIRAFKSDLRFPAPSEADEAGTDGWAPEITAALKDIDAGKKQIRVVGYTAASSTFAYGDLVRFVSATKIKNSLPGEEYVPNIGLVDLGDATASVDQTVGVLLNSVKGTTPSATNTMVYVAVAGYVPNVTVTGSPAVGDIVYASDTDGQMADTPGTIVRPIGTVMRVVSGTTVDIMVGPVATAASDSAPASWADFIKQLFNTDAGMTAGNWTFGIKFRPMTTGKSCSGVRFYWSGNQARTVKCRLWAGGVSQANVDVNVTTTGWYTGTFASPVALDTFTDYFATIWETSGTEYPSMRNTQNIIGTAPWRLRDYLVIVHAIAIAGDNEPNAAQTGFSSEIEPVL
jgi:hypothetical protein